MRGLCVSLRQMVAAVVAATGVLLSDLPTEARQVGPVPPDSAEEGSASYARYLGTSLFVLPSLLPGDGTVFLEIDFGRKVDAHADIILGANVYRYTAPMWAQWTHDTEYPGYVVSSGIVIGYQRYVWRGVFVDALLNPLVLRYHHDDRPRVDTGFMLLGTLRLGYHVDFGMFGRPFYLEAGGEASYWPYNGGVPPAFRALDGRHVRYVFSPALQVGYRF